VCRRCCQQKRSYNRNTANCASIGSEYTMAIFLSKLYVSNCSGCILENASSNVQLMTYLRLVISGDRHWSMEPSQTYSTNTISSKYVLIFLTKGGYSFRRFFCSRKLILDCWRGCSSIKSTFANIEFNFMNKYSWKRTTSKL